MSKTITAAMLCMIATTWANEPTLNNSRDSTPPPLGDNIVGESVPLYMEIYYHPANYCKVDPAMNLNEQLMHCKSKRKGWLKI